MATASGIHTAICAAIEAVDGLTESTLPWSLDAFPETLHSGGFMVRPVDGGEQPSPMAGITAVELRFEVLIPWRLTGTPNAHARTGMTKIAAARTALHADPLGDARIRLEPTTYTYSDDGHRMVGRFEVVASALLS
jgi:hypothetical protein